MSRREHRAPEVVGVIGALYAIHSLFAWRRTKALARRLLGPRSDDGLYRLFYSAQSVVCAVFGVLWFLRQPDQELYRLRRPWSLLARAAQLGGVVALLDMLRVVGPLRLLGVSQALAALMGRTPPATPVAQGPFLRADGAIDRRGLFAAIRHPDNLPAVLIFLGFPRMTWNRLALAVTSAVYAVVGSLHEDARLREAYGEAFERYARETPLFLPRLRRAAPTLPAGHRSPTIAQPTQTGEPPHVRTRHHRR